MLVTKTSMFSGVTRTLEMDVTPEQMSEWETSRRERLVQDIFPQLSAADREFIMTGVTQDEWDKGFPPDDDDNTNDEPAF